MFGISVRSNLARCIDQSILTKGEKKDRNWKMRVFKIVFSGSHHFQHYCTDCLYEGSGWFVEDDKRSGPLCYFQKKISTFYSVYQVTWKLDRFNSTKELTLNGCLMDNFFHSDCFFHRNYIFRTLILKRNDFFVKSSSE